MTSSLKQHIQNIWSVPTKSYLCICLIVLLSSCSSSKSINSTAGKQKKEAAVVFPNQQTTTPANVNFIYDYESIFIPQEEKSLDSIVRNFEKSNLIAIKITTISDTALTIENFDTNNKAVLNEWKALHGKSEKCMSISISKKLHRIRIDYGSFVNLLLSDDETNTIIESHFKPSFIVGKYFDGTVNGLNAIMDNIRNNIKF